MNFFQHQEQARRLSRRLVVLFVLAVLAVVVAVDLAVFTLLASVQSGTGGVALPTWEWLRAHLPLVIMTTLSVVGIIGLSSLYKTVTLSGGGGVVARSLGGVRVSPDTTDPLERRLLNVVEEMAIASGVPMPEVYLLEQESGINAFAAGHNPSNAAVAVTRGTLQTLTRAELQGVIAHEFAHILNGDMRLNVRLMGMLFGLLVIALIARTVLRFAPRGRRSSRDSKGGGGIAIVLIAAFVILIVGYVGLFFGRLIQAAVSRTRESLADASAVQFTRDPSGLRGALLKIGATTSGSRLMSPETDGVAHMLFAPGMKRLFATHPPLLQRLKAIDPHFDPAEIDTMRARLAAAAQADQATQAAQEAEPSGAQRLQKLLELPAAGAVTQWVGNPTTEHIQTAHELRASLPDELMLATRHPDSARALLLALAIERDAQARERQLRVVRQQLGAAVVTTMIELLPAVDALHVAQRMPTLLLAFPALRQFTRDERLQLMACLNGLLQHEGRRSLPAYVLRKLAQVHLYDDLHPRARSGHAPLAAVTADLQVLFSVLARYGHEREVEARRAYEAGMHVLLPRQRPEYHVPADWGAALDVSLRRLDALLPIAKEQLVEALTRTVTHDHQVTVNEMELLRAVCASLHCPLPPLGGADGPATASWFDCKVAENVS